MAVRNGRDPNGIVIQSSPALKRRRASCVARNETDEVQYALHKSLIKVKSFYDPDVQSEYQLTVDKWKAEGEKGKKPKSPFEKEAEQWLIDNPIKGQYSDIGHLDSGLHYITLPNVISETILKAIDETVQEHNLRVPLGISWITGSNWYHCH